MLDNCHTVYKKNPADYLKIAFTDNVIVNGAGYDFIVFEVSGVGVSDSIGCTVSVSVGDASSEISKVPTWVGADWYAAYYDLSEFGIAPGSAVSTVTLWNFPIPGDPDYGIVGAYHSASVPVPASLLLLGPALAGLAAVRKKLRP